MVTASPGISKAKPSPTSAAISNPSGETARPVSACHALGSGGVTVTASPGLWVVSRTVSPSSVTVSVWRCSSGRL